MAEKQYCIHGEENCNRCAMNSVEAPTVHLHVLIDISTSMISRWNQTIGGLNEYIAARRLDSTPYKVTITTFGLENEVNDMYSEADLDSIKKFDAKTFYPNGGGTALWGAVGISLKKITTAEPVLFIVITDGEENSSHVYTSKSVDELIGERTKLGNYTFAYLGVDKAAWGQETQVKAFAASNNNVDSFDYGIDTYRSLSATTSTYSSNMAASAFSGQSMSMTNFFSSTPDISPDPVVTTTTTPVNSQVVTPKDTPEDKKVGAGKHKWGRSGWGSR